MKKKQYTEPTIKVMPLLSDNSLMAASDFDGRQVYNEEAGEGVTGLSRRQTTVWNEDDEE